jgi:hypothetical protein
VIDNNAWNEIWPWPVTQVLPGQKQMHVLVAYGEKTNRPTLQLW